MDNIRNHLWDSECTGEKEYLLRRWFYGNLTKVGDRMSDNMGFTEDILNKVESVDNGIPEYEVVDRGSRAKPESFGWEEGYNWEMRQYLKYGVESFKIYD